MASQNKHQFNQNGVVNGTYFCNINEDTILSNRIAERNLPSAPLQPQIGMRPASTKYSIMPIVDPRTTSQLIPLKNYPNYNLATTFNPGNAVGPWSGFASNIDTYSKLRNQGVALQSADQGKYIPSSSSDLYETLIPVTDNQQNHPLLFKNETYNSPNRNIYNMGKKIFSNDTRQDVKNIRNYCHKDLA